MIGFLTEHLLVYTIPHASMKTHPNPLLFPLTLLCLGGCVALFPASFPPILIPPAWRDMARQHATPGINYALTWEAIIVG